MATETPAESARDIHLWFGLSYANYLVLPRTLLQSMPEPWQVRFVAMLEELDDAFAHVPQAQAYEVKAAEEHEVCDLTEGQLALLGITMGGKCEHGADCPDSGDCANAEVTYSSFERSEMDPWERVLVPVADPVPHYNRGRTYIAPGLPGQEETLTP